MAMLFAILIPACTWFMVLAPTLRWNETRIERRCEEAFKHHKIRTLRRLYPELKQIPYHDIGHYFDIDACYNNIGRSSYAVRDPDEIIRL